MGHGGFARKAKRLVKIEEAESPEEVIAEIERVFAETPKKVGCKPKTVTTAQKPLETPSVDYKQWIDYYQQQAQALREQEAMNDLLAQAKLRLQALQEQETLKRLEGISSHVANATGRRTVTITDGGIMDSKKEIQRGEAAEQLLRNELLVEAFDMVENGIIEQWICPCPRYSGTARA